MKSGDLRGAGLIVVGSRGRTGSGRLLLGSVARNVLHHAPCSLLVVHPPRHAADEVGVKRETGPPDEANGPGIGQGNGSDEAGG